MFFQAARIGIEPDRVHLELDLTPGSRLPTPLSDAMIAADGIISAEEERAHAQRVSNAV